MKASVRGFGRIVTLGCVSIVLSACSSQADKRQPEAKPATGASAKAPVDLAPVKASIERGVAYLLQGQSSGPLLGGHPGVAAMALLAVAHSPKPLGKDDPRVAPTLAALAQLAKPDGAIGGPDYSAYTTALAALALQAFDVHPELVKKAQTWLTTQQFSESNGVEPSNVNWGGIGYGSKGDADLSNLHYALAALHDTHFSDKPEVYTRALKFIERCQNRSESNDQPWAGNDGGFIYRPGVSKAGTTASSGSMTYAGVNAFIYAKVDKTDPRVKDAFAWIRAHYSVTENPGLGLKGLYYYYHVMAQALALLGESTLTDSQGVVHPWFAELSGQIMALQKPDGSWVNTDETYWEANPVIATSRALLALEYGFAMSAQQAL